MDIVLRPGQPLQFLYGFPEAGLILPQNAKHFIKVHHAPHSTAAPPGQFDVDAALYRSLHFRKENVKKLSKIRASKSSASLCPPGEATTKANTTAQIGPVLGL